MSKPQITSSVQVVDGTLALKHDTVYKDQPVLSMHSFGMTDQGRTRPSNEDHFLIASLHKAL